MKKFLAVLLLVAMTMSLAACGDKEEAGADLVKVEDKIINEGELEEYLQFTAFVQGIDLAQFPEETLQTIRAQMLEDMISMECIKNKYAGKEDEIFPDTIEEERKSFLDQARNTEAINSFLEENNISDQTLDFFFYSQYYRQPYFEEIQEGMPNLEQDALAYYETYKDSFAVDEVTAGHILVEKEETAKEILAKLDAGETFEDLAKEYGTDGTKDNGGQLGTFGRGEMVKAFEDAAFAMKPGEISDPVKSDFGYHIIQVTDKRQGTRDYEEVKDSIISNLVSQEALKQIKVLKESTKIEYLTDKYTGETEEETEG